MTWGKIYKNMRKRGIAYKPKPSYNQIQANQQRKQLIKDIAWKQRLLLAPVLDEGVLRQSPAERQKISVEQAEQMLKNAAKDLAKK